MSEGKPVSNLELAPAFESRYCCERCPSFAVKSEFSGHHVCSNDESGLNLVRSIQWGKTRLWGWDLKFKNDVCGINAGSN